MTKSEEFRNNKKERTLKITVKDSLKASRVSLLFVSCFELWFIVYWFLRGKQFTVFGDVKYFICYIFLIAVCLISFGLSFLFNRNYDKDYKKMWLLQNISGSIIFAWSVVITIFDLLRSVENSFLVYASVIVILPVVIYMNIYFMLGLYLTSDILIIIFTIIYNQYWTGVVTNFLVFSVVSFIAALSYYRIRNKSIERGLELNDIARIDSLTKLFNRQALTEISPRIMASNVKCKTELTLVMMDIDDFKDVNDTYGHAVGDKVLRYVARLVQEETDNSNKLSSCYRYGGEEFLLVFSDTSSHQAVNVVEAIMRRLKEDETEFDFRITVSSGIYTIVPGANENIEKYYTLADELLYKAKHSGKNCYFTNK